MEGLYPTADEGATRELVQRMQAGDEHAWTELYANYRDELLFYVRARLGSGLRSALESEDVLQSVAFEAFRSMPRFEPRERGSLRRWLRAIVLNKIRDRADTFGAAKRAGGVPLTDSVARTLARDEPPTYADPLFDRLERALAELPAELRDVVVLRRVEERSSREVAELLGKSEEAVRKILSRALARLTLRMGAADGEPAG